MRKAAPHVMANLRVISIIGSGTIIEGCTDTAGRLKLLMSVFHKERKAGCEENCERHQDSDRRSGIF